MKFLTDKLSLLRGTVGVSQKPGGVAVCHIAVQGDILCLTACEFLSGTPGEQGALLQDWLRDRGLTGSRAVFALAVDDYQLLQITPPEVPEKELREAARWQIRDLLDFPLEEAVVDIFQVPRDAQREGARTAYVVVARQNLLRQKVALLRASQLKLQAIDIPELVLRNIGNLVPDAERGVALLYFDADSGVMIICRGGKLCLSRTMNVGVESLKPDAPFWKEAVDSLALEIQRSLDFFESNFSQSGLASLTLAPSGFDSAALRAHLSETLGVAVQSLEVSELIDCKQIPEQPEHCLLAIGAALRNEVVRP